MPKGKKALPKKSLYSDVIVRVFEQHFKPGQTRFDFAREDGDTRAKGEQEAESLYMQGRLEDINATLKAKADSGEIPRHLVPSYQQGAAYR